MKSFPALPSIASLSDWPRTRDICWQLQCNNGTQADGETIGLCAVITQMLNVVIGFKQPGIIMGSM